MGFWKEKDYTGDNVLKESCSFSEKRNYRDNNTGENERERRWKRMKNGCSGQ